MTRQIFMNATPEGAGLDLTYEQEHNNKLVYQRDETDPGRYLFAGFWDPEEDYPDDQLVVPLRSVFGGTAQYLNNQVFANIIGSTGDPRHGYTSWLDIFRQNGVPCGNCVTDGYFYAPYDRSGRTYFVDYRCGGGMKGGHVVDDFNNASPAAGSRVYLIPICHNHNSCCTDVTGRNGSGFFMMPRTAGTAVVLNNYLRLGG